MFIRIFAAFVLGVFAPSSLALQIFACEPEWGALARELGGEQVEVYTATTALQDVHKIQARPSLIAKYRQADLLICTGADLEAGWLPALAAKGNNPRLRQGAPGYFEAYRYIKMLDVPASLDRAQGDVHAFGNPHIQTDPHNILAIAAPLSRRIAELDPANVAAYQTRLAEFEKRWRAAIIHWEAKARPLANLNVVSAHQGWAYLYRWLGLKEVATLEPKPGIPPSAGHLARVQQQLKSSPAAFVIYAAYQDERPALWLSERANIPAVKLPFSVGGTEEADDLLGLYAATIDRLLAAVGHHE